MAGFEDFKQEIIDLQKRTEINHHFIKYIQAETFDDIISIFKTVMFSNEKYENNFSVMQWSIENGLLEERIISMIPTIDLENKNIFNTSVILTNPISNTVIREGGQLQLTMNSSNKSKLILLGGTATVTMSGTSFLEIELYNDAELYLECQDSSYVYLNILNEASYESELNDDSILALMAQGDSTGTVTLNDDAFINATTLSSAVLQVKGKILNGKYYQREESRIYRQRK